MADGEPELTDDLKRLLMRKRELETELVDVERRIYALEESYIQDTAALGNIIKGWSGYLSSRSLEQVKQITRKVKDSDRLFTLSSTSGFPSNTEDERTCAHYTVYTHDAPQYYTTHNYDTTRHTTLHYPSHFLPLPPPFPPSPSHSPLLPLFPSPTLLTAAAEDERPRKKQKRKRRD